MILNRFFLLILSCSVSFFTYAQDSSSKATVKVSGEVTKPLNLTMSDVVKMKPVTLTSKDRNGKDHEFKGANIAEILSMAGVTMDKQLRGENLSKYLLVKCADGYEVLFSLAELDSSFTDRVTILAYETDGKPLASSNGPFRLVIPGEKKPARSAMQVVGLIVKFAKE